VAACVTLALAATVSGAFYLGKWYEKQSGSEALAPPPPGPQARLTDDEGRKKGVPEEVPSGKDTSGRPPEKGSGPKPEPEQGPQRPLVPDPEPMPKPPDRRANPDSEPGPPKPEPPPETVPQRAARLLKGAEPAERLQGVELLAKEKPVEAALLLCQLLAEEKNADVQQAAVVALRAVRPDLYPHVAALLFGQPQEADKHLQALGRRGEFSAAAAPAVRAALQRHLGDDVAARNLRGLPVSRYQVGQFLTVLIQMAPESPETFQAITQVVHLEGQAFELPAVRAAGVAALGELCRKRPESRKAAVPILVPLLSGSSDPLAAIAALRQCGPEAKAALPELKKLLTHANAQVRMDADRAITYIEKP
jgi:HEAT repeat protein